MATTALPRYLRAFGATGLFVTGALHATWAAGSNFPAHTEADLARAVTGADSMPPRIASAAVAALTLGTGIVVAGAGREGQIPTLVRVSTGAALLGRGLVGHRVGKLMGLPEPGQSFRRLDAAVYRPTCVLLGAAILASARIRS